MLVVIFYSIKSLRVVFLVAGVWANVKTRFCICAIISPPIVGLRSRFFIKRSFSWLQAEAEVADAGPSGRLYSDQLVGYQFVVPLDLVKRLGCIANFAPYHRQLNSISRHEVRCCRCCYLMRNLHLLALCPRVLLQLYDLDRETTTVGFTEFITTWGTRRDI